MTLMNKIPLDVWQEFMAHIYEVMKSPFNTRCDMRQASCINCVDPYVPRWDMWMWLSDINLYN